MDHKNPIDQWLEQSFEQTPPGDKDTLWARVSSSLDQTKKKKRLGFWWLFGAAAILGVLTLYFTATDKTSSTDSTPTIVQENKTDGNSSTANSPSQTKSNAANPDPSQTGLGQDRTSDPSLDLVENNNASNKGTQLSEETDKNTLQNEKSSNKQGASKKQTASGITKSSAKPQSNSKPTNKVKWVWLASPIQPKLLLSGVGNNSTTPELLNHKPLDLSFLRGEEDNPRHPIQLNSPWTFGVSAGFSPTIERISIASNGLPYVHKDYLKLRNEGERVMFNSQFELYIRKNLGNFFIQTGYSSMKRGFIQDYQYEINEIPIVLQFPGIAPDANGKYPIDNQAPYILDPTPEKVNYQGKRTSSFSEIPLNLGYTFNTGKLLISPSVGAGINFTQQAGGNTIDYQRLNIISYKELFKVSNTGYSFNSSIILEYPLSKNLFLQAQPFYHRFLKGNTEVIHQKPISYGLNIGLNLKLQNNE